MCYKDKFLLIFNFSCWRLFSYYIFVPFFTDFFNNFNNFLYWKVKTTNFLDKVSLDISNKFQKKKNNISSIMKISSTN